MSLQDAKAQMRRAALAARAQVGSEHRAQAAEVLCTVLAAHQGAVGGYCPMRDEADPLPALAQARGPVGMPVVVARAAPLRFRAWHPGCAMQPGAFGAQIPVQGDWIIPQILVVPLVAFDLRGGRLGYGGGFYDRSLAQLRAAGPVLAVGYGFSAQQLDNVPQEPTDQPLDLIVTEEGTRDLR